MQLCVFCFAVVDGVCAVQVLADRRSSRRYVDLTEMITRINESHFQTMVSLLRFHALAYQSRRRVFHSCKSRISLSRQPSPSKSTLTTKIGFTTNLYKLLSINLVGGTGTNLLENATNIIIVVTHTCLLAS